MRSRNAQDDSLCDDCGTPLRWHEAFICDLCAGKMTDETDQTQEEPR